MTPILDDIESDLRKFGDLVWLRPGILTDQGITIVAAGRGNALDDASQSLGRDDLATVPFVSRSPATFAIYGRFYG